MKQKKLKVYKMTRQWTDENRIQKKRLRDNIKASISRNEFDDDKIVPQSINNNNLGEKK